ncbi:unnamed protein product (macronuclear) [Paramecium tetraurelia]|uniref:protein-serine/threonine phosphatase n=1 Tax=Paramecium tetraurelia TaxID=5888 RepID=A0D9E0_PARTE|nr:uncharacterized protein GSPATT00014587001 [Paramecium tetraurelia]CAK79657.1 unnamed protein product [Paramecium tetraurelia]|eukprot:XP_001447054.1 hypothetical protein (macronuclear) [Paramecium tetraurelia strain d4-2]
MKQSQQSLKGIPNIRTQYYLSSSLVGSQNPQKINKGKSTYIDDTNKTKETNCQINEKSKSQSIITYKKINVSRDNHKSDDSQMLPQFKKDILKSRQSQQVIQKTKQQQRSDSPLIPIDSLPHIEPSKISTKNVGIVSAYAANTHQGLIRTYNEDRVSIILNLMKPASNTFAGQWPQSSFFAIYDGHGGAACADYMRDNLHQYIIREDCFPSNPRLAISRGIEKAEKNYLQLADQKVLDKSGSCAVIALIVDKAIYIANIGDSRAILSHQGKCSSITVDHKPSSENEQQRITKLGGQIYQAQIQVSSRLAVSRTLGDAEAKLPKYGGIQGVISAQPDIFQITVTDQDFLILACDGIFDKMNSEEVISSAWTVISNDVHHFAGKAVENIMRQSMSRKTVDNVTVVLIAFPQLEKKFKQQQQ